MTIERNGEKMDITDRQQMEAMITDENRKKYHQTENTCPFKSYPLYDDFGDIGIGPKTSLVIDRKYTPSPLLAQ